MTCESSAWQTIHMKYQDLFFSEKKKKKYRMSSAANFAWCFKGKWSLIIENFLPSFSFNDHEIFSTIILSLLMIQKG